MTKTAKKKSTKKKSEQRQNSNARIKDPRKNPKEWARWVIAARDRILGDSLVEAAAGISLSDRQLKKWINHPAWQDALREAEELCLQGLKHHSIAAVHKSVKRGNATMGLEIMKLTMKQLQKKEDDSGAPASITVNLGYGARGPAPMPEQEESDVPAIRSA